MIKLCGDVQCPHQSSKLRNVGTSKFLVGKLVESKPCWRLSDGKPSEDTLRDAIMRKTKGAAVGQDSIWTVSGVT